MKKYSESNNPYKGVPNLFKDNPKGKSVVEVGNRYVEASNVCTSTLAATEGHKLQ